MVRLRMRMEKRRKESGDHSGRVEEKRRAKRKELRASPKDKSSYRQPETTKERIIGRQTSRYKRKRTLVTYAIRGELCRGKCLSVVTLSVIQERY